MKTVYVDGNNWTFLWEGRTFAPATGAWELDSGLSPEAWFAATDTGAEIHASLKKSLALRAAGTGDYYATVLGSDITTHLTPYLDQRIFEVVKVGTVYRLATPVLVRDVREE